MPDTQSTKMWAKERSRRDPRTLMNGSNNSEFCTSVIRIWSFCENKIESSMSLLLILTFFHQLSLVHMEEMLFYKIPASQTELESSTHIHEEKERTQNSQINLTNPLIFIIRKTKSTLMAWQMWPLTGGPTDSKP